jgi:hypothetical protein|tara:strand:- start:1489 stop:1809 length:321 start_codon:yes stop_codon:yes gene_type:complete
MKLFEVFGSEHELAALIQYLISRSEKLGTKGKVGTESFLKMAENLGINVSLGQLQSMAQRVPLKNMVADVSPQHVSFDLQSNIASVMSVDKARDTVNSMAKRAMKR